jgi:hypothetical protein
MLIDEYESRLWPIELADPVLVGKAGPSDTAQGALLVSRVPSI